MVVKANKCKFSTEMFTNIYKVEKPEKVQFNKDDDEWNHPDVDELAYEIGNNKNNAEDIFRGLKKFVKHSKKNNESSDNIKDMAKNVMRNVWSQETINKYKEEHPDDKHIWILQE